jgi:uncharacterized membrane-anchored protein
MLVSIRRGGAVGLAMIVAAVLSLAIGRVSRADPVADAFRSIPWQQGPTKGEMGSYATIDVPEGFIFSGPEGAQKFLELNQNPPNPATIGVLLPVNEAESWVVYFDYHDSGHVKDDERDSIDAAELLATLKAGNEAGNSERRRRGWETLEVLDWVVPPGYEATTNRLAWGVRLRTGKGQDVANYDVRVLGRTGVVSVTLACDPAEVVSLVPRLQQLLGGFEFKQGQRYAEWRPGDKMAAYGLTGLIAGGATVAALKGGWLAKLAAVFAKAGKAIVIFFLAIAGGLWRLVTGQKGGARSR